MGCGDRYTTPTLRAWASLFKWLNCMVWEPNPNNVPPKEGHLEEGAQAPSPSWQAAEPPAG